MTYDDWKQYLAEVNEWNYDVIINVDDKGVLTAHIGHQHNEDYEICFLGEDVDKWCCAERIEGSGTTIPRHWIHDLFEMEMNRRRKAVADLASDWDKLVLRTAEPCPDTMKVDQ